jgi:hypothetical protein
MTETQLRTGLKRKINELTPLRDGDTERRDTGDKDFE